MSPPAGVLGRKLGAGREADVYAYGDSAVVKLYRPALAVMSPTPAWLVVHAAARLREGIEAERPMLINRLERARRSACL